MDLCLENMGQFVDLKCEQDSWRGGDSNAIILPQKKRNKQKSTSQGHKKVKVKENPKLSKSQKRKLKKLEEEKEKEQLWSKSIEVLEKYKIPENVYSLLQSSQNIGQAETMLEKRRRVVECSKAGFELPYGDQPFKMWCDNHASSEIESGLENIDPRQKFDENDHVESKAVGREVNCKTSVSLSSSQELACANEHGNGIYGGCDAALPVKVVTDKISGTSMQEDIKNISTSSMESMDLADESQKVNFSCRIDKPDCPLQRPLIAPTVVHVLRPSEVENNRKDLPIVMMEQEIMEAINDHSAIIICGETGCGKTTQVPQFLYEAGFGSNQTSAQSGIIGVTQPRRVAVLATAKRVSFELGLHLGKEVGFQVRHDKRVGNGCSIKFMTDGILMREVQSDFLLKRYSVIILDEAHERSLNTDILIGMLSRIIQVRQQLYEEQQKKVLSGETVGSKTTFSPLKLILMSATLRVEDFISGRRLFRDLPPVIEVPTRQFPVTVHFSKRTELVDYTGQAYKKVLSIHKKLPQGGILVFVTGQREVANLCKKLRKASRELIMKSSKGDIKNDATSVPEANFVEGISMKEINEAFETQGNSVHQQTDRFSSYDEDCGDLDEAESDFSYDSGTESELEYSDNGDSLGQKTSKDEDNLIDVDSLKAAFEALSGKATLKPDSGKQVTSASSERCLGQPNPSTGKKRDGESSFTAGALRVLPLYAMLSAAEQLRVFEEIKEGERLVVVATNVAETSLTIPGIKYVVDTGREKVKNYNPSNGMETYEVQWVSKASAAQRAGRAGRTGPGHCYRLYSSACYANELPDFSKAEISKIPVAGVVLLMKSMGIDKVANFPFPTPPDATALVEAERCLKALEALDSRGKLTLLGRAMAPYPMSPRHSRMLLTAIQIMKNVKSYARLTKKKKDHGRANLVLAYAVAAAAALSLSNPFMQFEGDQDGKSATVDEKQEKLRKKNQKDKAKLSRARFCNPSSDALTVAYALQCFELSRNPSEFCSENALHLKTMEEMSKLRMQLLQLVFNQIVSSGLEQEFTWTSGTMEDIEGAWKVSSDKHPLLLNEEELLGQAICAGWADRVAKRTKETSGSIRYQACVVKESVYLHRYSSLSQSAPEFLVYSELVETKRPYMHGTTRVKPEWLIKYARSLCSFSAPLLDPKPYFEALSDQVFCWVIPTFGPHLWTLPMHCLPISKDSDRVAVFAYALLEGQVLPCLKSVRKFMTAPPSSILRPEAAGSKRVGNLVNKLSRLGNVDNCTMLKVVWEVNPKELYSEILDWFQEIFHHRFEELWLQMHNDVVLEPRERFPKREKRKLK